MALIALVLKRIVERLSEFFGMSGTLGEAWAGLL
jgi:hypothetical protein